MAKIIVVKHRFLHGLSRQLSRQDTESLLDGDTVSRELVVGGEPRRVGALCDDTFQRLLAQRVDTLAVLSSSNAMVLVSRRRQSRREKKSAFVPSSGVKARERRGWSGKAYLVLGEHKMHFGRERLGPVVERVMCERLCMEKC